MFRRLIATALTLGLGLTLAACNPGSPTPSGSDTTSTSAPVMSDLDVVTHAADALLTTSYHLEGISLLATSKVDTDPGRRVSRQISTDPKTGNMITDTRYVEDDLYLGVGATFTHIDLNKLRADSATRALIHAAFVELLMRAITKATMTGPRAYEGTIDLQLAVEKSASAAIKRFAQSLFAVNKTPTIPFTATVDELGRVVRFDYTTDLGLDSGPTKNSYVISAYGQMVTVERPAANLVTEATEQMYAIM